MVTTRMSFVFAITTIVASAMQMAVADDTKPEADKVVKKKVARLRLKGSFPESPAAIGIFGELEQNLRGMIARLDRAAKDDSISAVVLRIQNTSVGRGKLAELRAAIARTQESGKKIIAELNSASTADYLLACACDEIIMPKSGVIMMPGVRAEVTFFGGLFEKLGIEADMLQVGDFKGAAEPFTRKSMSKEFRQQYTMLIDDFYNQMISTIATDRKLAEDKVKELIDVGLLSTQDAKKHGLVDVVAYADETEAYLKEHLKADEIDLLADYGKKKIDTNFSGPLGFMKLFELMMGGSSGSRGSKNKKIALVYAIGPIMTGSSTASLFGGETMGSDTIVKALRKAGDDDTVVAIVLRVDSPGGSALASDLIWREITRMEKPVVASMGDMAASGGYYISMGCDIIFAEAGTITGSIGVVGGKIVMSGLFEKAGIATDVISRGKNSGLLSGDAKFSDSEREVWKKMMEDTYLEFTQKAADGRKMKLADLEKHAGGRIWSGQRAQKVGLVDKVGTLRDAILEAKKLAGLGDEDKAEIMVLPKPVNVFDQLLGISAMAPKIIAPKIRTELGRVSKDAAKLLGQAQMIEQWFAEPSVLVMPYNVEIK